MPKQIKRKKDKIYLAIFVVVAIIVGGISWWIIKQGTKEIEKTSSQIQELKVKKEEVSQIDTSNWKTYVNEEYGYSVKVPEGWEKSEVFTVSKDKIVLTRLNVQAEQEIKREIENLKKQKASREGPISYFQDWIVIENFDNSEQLTSSQWFEQKYLADGFAEGYQPRISQQTLKSNNTEILLIDDNETWMLRKIVAFIPKDKYMIQITMCPKEEKFEAEVAKFIQFIKTFKSI